MTETVPKYAHLWKLRGVGNAPPLPLLPAFSRGIQDGSGLGSWTMLYTCAVADVPGHATKFLISGGLNLAYIPDFCGGTMFTSINARVMPARTGFMDESIRRQYDAAPRVSHFLGPNWWDQTEVYEDGEAFRSRMYDDTRADTLVYTRLRKLVIASVMAKAFLRAGGFNQHIMSFWDRNDGFTRHAAKWAVKALRAGVSGAGSYGRQRIYFNNRWGHHNHSAQYNLWGDLWGGDDVMRVHVYPYAYSAGRSRRNHNSGASVSGGQILCDRIRHKNNPTRGHTEIQCAQTAEWNSIMCGEHVTGLLRVPSMWHPM